ncbi:MAG: hypothetical protein ABSG64_12810 [Solirubrobacteraceae bacterium]
MSGETPALIAAAAGVGLGHAILPDHWMPLAVIGRAQRYPVRRVARLSILAGIAHVLVSILLGAVIIIVGLQFRSSIERAQGVIVGSVLILTGVGFAIYELTRRRYPEHHLHEHAHESDGGRVRGAAAIMVPFGAAASPDLTILPVFLAATAAGAFAAVGALVVFAAVTITTIVTLTLLACFGGYQIKGRLLDRWGNALTALVLVAIGTLVASGAI